jgi:LPXTG-site transpeptidase (sortase) family protein
MLAHEFHSPAEAELPPNVEVSVVPEPPEPEPTAAPMPEPTSEPASDAPVLAYAPRSSTWTIFAKNPLIITGAIGLLFLIFVSWLVLTLAPVLLVEGKYQYRKVLGDIFHVKSLRSLILPTLRFADLQGQSKHQDYGITIPTLFLDEPVVFNVDPNDKPAYTAALKKGIAHASGTGFPDNPGVGYYFAHSSSPELRTQFNAVFYLLGKLQAGDDIYIWHEQKRHHYIVTEVKETDPSDVSFLNQPYPEETIVLQTCWPPGTTQRRLLVFANRFLEPVGE